MPEKLRAFIYHPYTCVAILTISAVGLGIGFGRVIGGW